MTSYAGLVLFQGLFSALNLKQRLSRCLGAGPDKQVYSHSVVVMSLIVHLLLGYRRLQDIDYYRDDPMVLRLLGLSKIQNVPTLSRRLAKMTNQDTISFRDFIRQLVLERLAVMQLSRITLDFDGSVISTGRYAEGTAVGYNRKKKGLRILGICRWSIISSSSNAPVI